MSDKEMLGYISTAGLVITLIATPLCIGCKFGAWAGWLTLCAFGILFWIGGAIAKDKAK